MDFRLQLASLDVFEVQIMLTTPKECFDIAMWLCDVCALLLLQYEIKLSHNTLL